MEWRLKKFEDLGVHELYAILQLRNIVFAVEQNCVYPDMDNKDAQSLHLMAWEKDPASGTDQLMAYTRLLPPGVSYPDAASIGRVVTAPAARGKGLGRELMQRSLKALYQSFGRGPVRIGAQLYLKDFYASLGFAVSSEMYLEDGIEHIEMLLA